MRAKRNELENNGRRCPVCGGRMVPNQKATIPFVLKNTIAVIKDVPAELCASCHESYTTGEVTDNIVELLRQLHSLQTEVSIVSYKPIPVAI
jgi:YgiT-type zinc finger domain-containing protein